MGQKVITPEGAALSGDLEDMDKSVRSQKWKRNGIYVVLFRFIADSLW